MIDQAKIDRINALAKKARSPEGLTPAETEERAARAGALAARLKAAYLEQWVGASLPVLFEEEKDGLWRGHAPNYVEVMARGKALHNVIRDVNITELHGDGLFGQVL